MKKAIAFGEGTVRIESKARGRGTPSEKVFVIVMSSPALDEEGVVYPAESTNSSLIGTIWSRCHQ